MAKAPNVHLPQHWFKPLVVKKAKKKNHESKRKNYHRANESRVCKWTTL